MFRACLYSVKHMKQQCATEQESKSSLLCMTANKLTPAAAQALYDFGQRQHSITDQSKVQMFAEHANIQRTLQHLWARSLHT